MAGGHSDDERTHQRGDREGVVSGNDQRVAVVILKHACVRVCVGSLTGRLSADGSIMTALIYDLADLPLRRLL